MTSRSAVASHRKPDLPDPDGDVVDLVRQGNVRTALHHLMRRHGTAVYRYCRSELRDATLADDVHQQVFIEALRDLPRFSSLSTLRIWVFAIARHRVLDAAKKRRRELRRLDNGDGPEPVDHAPSPGQSIDDALDDARLGQVLVASLGKLNKEARTAVLLRFQQGFTFEEMAQICGEKPGTLHARVVRSLPQLRALIEAQLGPESASSERLRPGAARALARKPSDKRRRTLVRHLLGRTS